MSLEASSARKCFPSGPSADELMDEFFLPIAAQPSYILLLSGKVMTLRNASPNNLASVPHLRQTQKPYRRNLQV